MGFRELVKDAQVVAVYCNQWGDTGKGKFSDYFSLEWADVIARGTGGNNAGHTVVVGGNERIFHLIPAGAPYDSLGKITILGKGMVIDPNVLVEELQELETEGIEMKHLLISRDAHVVMPYHITQDKAKHMSQNNGGIGTTGRGIGPCYTDKTARRGIRLQEFLDEKKLIKKLEKVREEYGEENIDVENIISSTREVAKKIQRFVVDTDAAMQQYLREGKKVLLEGAQGLLLSVEHGTYPYVTSSDCSINGMANGAGIRAGQIDIALGIVKFPFMTRVGGGPFPTELGREKSEEYCSEEGHEKTAETEAHGARVKELMNSKDPYEQGIGIRIKSGEYGATTGRPRRIGWTDSVAAKYATEKNGPLMILTKVDCLSGVNEFKLCVGYEKDEEKTEVFQTDEEFLRDVKPVYKTYKGYGDITDVKNYEAFPETLKEAIQDFEKFTGGQVVGVSTGADREAVVWR